MRGDGGVMTGLGRKRARARSFFRPGGRAAGSFPAWTSAVFRGCARARGARGAGAADPGSHAFGDFPGGAFAHGRRLFRKLPVRAAAARRRRRGGAARPRGACCVSACANCAPHTRHGARAARAAAGHRRGVGGRTKKARGEALARSSAPSNARSRGVGRGRAPRDPARAPGLQCAGARGAGGRSRS